MNKAIYIITFIWLLLIDCAIDPLAGGSTDTELGGNVVGFILNDNGEPAPNTRVLLISYDYNPVVDEPIPDSLIDTTDEKGYYNFTVSDTGIFNIEAVHYSQKTRTLEKGILVNSDTTHVPDATLKEPGTIEIHMPDTVDTCDGYVYIPGTTLYRKFSDVMLIGNGKYSLTLESVPASTIPVVVYKSEDWDFYMTDLIMIESNETVIIDLSANTIKPLWHFTLIVGISGQTVSFYGGMDSVKILVEKHVNGITSKFNNPGVFNGIYRFTVDSIYQYSNDVTVEIDKPMTGFDYRLLYDGYSAWGNGGWYYDTRTVCRVWDVNDGDGTFGQSSVDITTWEFGQARGAIVLSWIEVDAANNPISHTDYNVTIESIMNYPYGINVWDEASVNLINYYDDDYYLKPNIINRSFPASMGIIVKSSIGSDLPGASVNLYGIKLLSSTVDNSPVLSGITGASGEFVFPVNPYNPDSSDYLNYYNMLISVEFEGDTVYAWEPVFDATNAWFANPDSTYRIVVHF